MEASPQRNLRMIHHLSEILDLDLDDSANSNISDFVALISAMREGLMRIDDDFQIPDSQINTLFLSKLKVRPEWEDWAMEMLRDARVCGSGAVIGPNSTGGGISFRELADLAIAREGGIQRQRQRQSQQKQQQQHHHHTGAGVVASSSRGGDRSSKKVNLRDLTQDEINAFVVRQMRQDGRARPHSSSHKGHMKKPSQEEINHFVVQQMRKQEEKKTRNRSHSQPEPSREPSRMHSQKQKHQGHQRNHSTQAHCTFCGASYHPSSDCWRRWRVAAEAPQGNYVPKRVEFKTEMPGQAPMYRSGFTLN